MWLSIAFIIWLLVGCATISSGNAPEPLLFGLGGERPSVCYVRAKHFNGLVPMSCIEAAMVRP
jgi:hypothetical protein